MPVDDPEAAILVEPEAPDPGMRLTDDALLGWLLAREAFHLRGTIRQTHGSTRKRAFARLDQVQELLRRFGGPYALKTAEPGGHAPAVAAPRHPLTSSFGSIL